MKSLQLLIGVICLSVFIGYSSADDEILEFHHLSIMDKDGSTNDVEVCFKSNGLDLTGYSFYHLSIFEEFGEDLSSKALPLSKPQPEQLAIDPICLTCEGCLSTEECEELVKAEAPTFWLLTIEEKSDLMKAIPLDSKTARAFMEMPDALPVTSLMFDIYVIGKDDAVNKVFKINEKFDQIFWNNDDLTFIFCTKVPCYYKHDLDISKGYSFTNCVKEGDSQYPLCGGSKEGTPINIEGDISQATVLIDCNIKSDHRATFSSTDSVYTEAIIKATIDSEPTCDIANCKVTADLTVTLVDYTGPKFLEIIVTDRELDAHELGAGTNIVEVKWPKVDKDFFKMSRTSLPDDSQYHTANVDCTLEETNCYAYFVDVAVGEHTIQIQEIKVWVEHPIPENNIWQKSATSTALKKNQAIHAEPTVITVTESNIVLDICYTYITNTSNVNTHYEFLAINSKGKWKKEIVNKKKDDSHACFNGLELPLADFSEGSKFLVLLRDSDNGKPLASGEVTIDLPAFRAIKPEVDNGNNGSTSTLAIVGAAIAGIACLMALVAAAIMFVMKINRNNDGLQYPLQHNNIEDSSTIHGLDNSIPTM